MGDDASSAEGAAAARPTGLVRLADRLVEAAAVVLMLAMLATVVLGVVTRAIGRPVVWSDELAQYLLVWLGFVGFILASRRDSHIRITVLLDRLPGPVRQALEIAIRVGIVVFALVLIWQAGPLIQRNIDVETVTLPFPSAMLYVLLPVLGLALVVQSVAEIAGVTKAATAADRSNSESRL